jgi:hypothetical protein
MFAEIRRASSPRLNGHPLSLLLILPILRFATDSDSDLFELANDFRSLSQPIAVGHCGLARVRRERSIFLFDSVKVLLIGLNGLDFTFGRSGHGVQFPHGTNGLEAADVTHSSVKPKYHQSNQNIATTIEIRP